MRAVQYECSTVRVQQSMSAVQYEYIHTHALLDPPTHTAVG
jgi:hypothetical protein